jgi:hypothetical protein
MVNHFGVLMAIVLICALAYIIYFNIQNVFIKKYKLEISQKNKSISSLQGIIVEESSNRAHLQKRVRELEDAIKDGTGISLRNEITQINVAFDKIEMETMVNGIVYLIEKRFNRIDDVKYYVTLIEKLSGAIRALEVNPNQKEQGNV